MLIDRPWKLKYTPEDGDLVQVFYVPALQDAARYDRLTGYFDAGALALAARGVEGLVRNDGRMRLVVGCTLREPEIEAIGEGAALRDLVERRLVELPLAPPDADAADALELLAWMIGRGHLDVKVAVPCHAGRPVSDTAIFHEKSGVVEDRAGHRIAWTGSLNETAAGWRRNWESINVYRSWGPEPERVAGEERNFARLWANRSPRAIVLDVPDAARRDLLRFLPADLPARLKAKAKRRRTSAEPPGPGDGTEPPGAGSTTDPPGTGWGGWVSTTCDDCAARWFYLTEEFGERDWAARFERRIPAYRDVRSKTERAVDAEDYVASLKPGGFTLEAEKIFAYAEDVLAEWNPEPRSLAAALRETEPAPPIEPKPYEVECGRWVYETATVTVDARDAEEAADLARKPREDLEWAPAEGRGPAFVRVVRTEHVLRYN